MNIFYKSAILFFSFIGCLNVLFAQNTGSWQPEGIAGKTLQGIIKGKVVDENSDLPLEYATFTLFNQIDRILWSEG